MASDDRDSMATEVFAGCNQQPSVASARSRYGQGPGSVSSWSPALAAPDGAFCSLMPPGRCLPEPDQPNARSAKYTAIPAEAADSSARINPSKTRESPPPAGAIEAGRRGS
jgi:hypothetical protein